MLLGNWKQAEPSGCATKCGVAAGKSGTPGAVTCSTSSCNADTKPAAKQCPKTVDCGTFEGGMPTVETHSHHHLLPHHEHLQPSQTTTHQPIHAHAIFSLRSHLDTAELIFVYDGRNSYLRFVFPDYSVSTLSKKKTQIALHCTDMEQVLNTHPGTVTTIPPHPTRVQNNPSP